MNNTILEEFYKIITPNKVEMFERLGAERTKFLTVVMENVYQEHNASAVLRTCDCFGIQELHVIEKDNEYKVQRDIARGAGRWTDMYTYNEGNTVTKDCILSLRDKGYKIVATTPHTEKTIHTMDLSQPVALVFGTERKGISEEVTELADEFVKIPMYGFTESFNISVSVAVILSTLRQRLQESTSQNWRLSQEEQTALKIEWCKRILNGGEKIEEHFIRMLSDGSTY